MPSITSSLPSLTLAAPATRGVLSLLLLSVTAASAAPIERIWLSHEDETPATLTVNWESDAPSPSVVTHGSGPEPSIRLEVTGLATRHHVRIPFKPGAGHLHFRVGDGDAVSAVHRVKRHPADALRLAVVADWGFAPGRDFSSLLRDDPHLLLTGGDNVPDLHGRGREGTRAFAALIDACHAWQEDSEQFRWYAATMRNLRAGFVVTLMNEKQTQLAGATKGAWQREFQRGSALITGFGYFSERAELAGGLPVFNTCLKGDGDLYLDPRSRFHAREDGYLLLTLEAGRPTMRVEIKSLRGAVLDAVEIAKRPGF